MADDIALSAALEREHEEIDAGLDQFEVALEGGTVAAEPFHAAATALRRHIYLEEKFLFPPLRTGGMLGPLAVMVREHGEIWQALDAVEERIANGLPAADVRPALDALLRLLDDHNMKEERVVYPALDQVIVGEQAARMHGRLTDVRESAAGWTCQALRP